ncbi:ankyrin repeat domain-containing protein [Bacteriovorax sp. Seq25_V]|uniref:ankyrin repeat domain-containing protein n=1 Tax=Bacteriovorax sp. Seq25_V TaxID=1201288 RepID=UPI00038A49B0|nr:ankyrin repeat domain-containing protein [Bacteriovorax sp. Seq25_V]EQC46017.1 ankyrin repeat protein [Bacteriovorax sp. Seq25_V]
MKKLSLLKILFLIITIAFAIYSFQNFYLKPKNKKILSISPENIERIKSKMLPIENRPLSYDFKTNQENKNVDSDSEYLDELIKRSGIDYISPKEGMNILMLAIEANRDDLFEKYLDHFKDLEYKNNFGATALVLASSGGDINFVKNLLNKGADPNVEFNRAKFTLLMDAAMEGNTELIRLLLAKGARVNDIDNTGMTALLYASREGHTEVVRILIENNADKSVQNKKKMKAIDYAYLYKFDEIISILK